MASTTEDQRTTGGLAAAISNAVVHITAQYTGRGPTKARASVRDDMIVVLMQDTLTRAERTLLADGQGDFVLETRSRFQGTMRDDLIAAVERLTERRVLAFMSANHVDPDMGAEIFVMEPRDGAPRVDAASRMTATSSSAQGIGGSDLGARRAAEDQDA